MLLIEKLDVEGHFDHRTAAYEDNQIPENVIVDHRSINIVINVVDNMLFYD